LIKTDAGMHDEVMPSVDVEHPGLQERTGVVALDEHPPGATRVHEHRAIDGTR
jgi:hypothetical protein